MKRIVLALACTVACIGPAAAQEKSGELIPSITVVGTGQVESKPDQAEITIGVMTEAETASDALQDNTGKMKRLMEELERLGIDEKDIQTSNFSVSPRYAHDPKGRRAPEIDGYQVSNQVQIKVRKLSGLGRVLDDLISSGANQVHGISFSLGDSTNTMDDARRKAMADARRKAELYAKAARVELGRPLLIQEQVQGQPRPPMPYMRMAAAESDAVPISPGELTTSAQIHVTYAIEPVHVERGKADRKAQREQAEEVQEEQVEVKEEAADITVEAREPRNR